MMVAGGQRAATIRVPSAGRHLIRYDQNSTDLADGASTDDRCGAAQCLGKMMAATVPRRS